MGDPPTDPAVEIIEIPLIGDEPTAPIGDEPPTGAPNWRRIVGIGLVGGTGLGIAIGVIVLTSGSESDAEPPTTGPSDPAGEPADRITTPPTLAPLGTLPRPEITTAPTLDDGPLATSSQDRTLFDTVEPPEYPGARDVTPSELDRYDLATAVTGLAEDLPRRSETQLELGRAGFVLDVTIERDPARNRYRLTFGFRGRTEVAIVDNATGSTYVDPGTDDWQIVANEEIIADSSATTVNEYFDRLLLGPIRPGTWNEAATSEGGVVVVDDVGPARRFDVAVSGDLVPEWQLYEFGPVNEFTAADRPSSLDYAVYVDDLGRVAQVNGVASVGTVAQLVQHRLVHLDEPVRIDLPPAAATTIPAR